MLGPRVDLELPIHRFAELGLRQHAVHSLFDHAGRTLLPDDARALFAQPAFVSAVIAVDLLFFLLAGQANTRGIDDDDVITGVEKGGPGSFVLALQQACGRAGDASENLAICVDDVPLPATS